MKSRKRRTWEAQTNLDTSNVCYPFCLFAWTFKHFFPGASSLDSFLAAFSQVKSATSRFFPAPFHPRFVLANVTGPGAAEMLPLHSPDAKLEETLFSAKLR